MKDGSAETGAQMDSSIAKLNVEIERMAPNLKATDKCVACFVLRYLMFTHTLVCLRYDDVEAKITQAEDDADAARKESKKARDEFNKIKKNR